MKVETHDGFSDPRSIKATRVVIYDRFDNPLAVAVEAADDCIIVETAAEHSAESFNSILRNLGIHKSVIVKDMKEKPLPEIRIPRS